MRIRIVTAAVLSAALVAAVAIPLANGASGERTKALQATLSGKNEIDQQSGRRNAGDRNGLGSFSAVVDSGQLCFGIVVRDLDAPVAAHIHRGGSSVNGPVVVPLTQPAEGDPGASSACIAIDDPLATQILRRPSRFYVNVHTGPFPNGAVRGQLKAQRR
jgi:hypothetical protein